jgi:hypothetical protein
MASIIGVKTKLLFLLTPMFPSVAFCKVCLNYSAPRHCTSCRVCFNSSVLKCYASCKKIVVYC